MNPFGSEMSGKAEPNLPSSSPSLSSPFLAFTFQRMSGIFKDRGQAGSSLWLASFAMDKLGAVVRGQVEDPEGTARQRCAVARTLRHQLPTSLFQFSPVKAPIISIHMYLSCVTQHRKAGHSLLKHIHKFATETH